MKGLGACSAPYKTVLGESGQKCQPCHIIVFNMANFSSLRGARGRLPEVLYKGGVGLAACLILGQTGLWILLREAPARVILNDLASVLGSLLAFAAMLYAARWSARFDRRLGRSWGLFTLAMFSWALGDLLWAALELGWKTPPYPSLADFFYLVSYPLFLAGILTFPRQLGENRQARGLWLDIFIVMLSAVGIYWNLFLNDLLSEPAARTALLIAAAYPIGDLLLILTATLILFQPRLPQWFAPFLWMLAGLSFMAFADAIFSLASPSFDSSLFYNLLFTLVPLLLMLSGLSQALQAERAVKESRTMPFHRYEGALKTVRLVIPFLWLLLAYILLHVGGGQGSPDQALLHETWMGVIILLLVVREVLVSLDNEHLANELRGLNDTLEKRVAERASSLTLANYELRREMDERRRIEVMLREREERLAHFALHDALTGLPNRALLTDRLSQAIQRGLRHPNERYAVLFLDFDSFKVVNDSLGHLVGDQLLIQIGQRLTSLVRASDTVARLGGDEFIVLLDGFRADGYVNATAQRLLDAFLDPFHLDSHTIYITASIGVVVSSPEYQSAVEIIRDADLAMYSAKTNGKARFMLFVPEMRHSELNRMTLQTELHHALASNELVLYHQPIYETRTGQLHGVEALVRWRHPARGLIGPAEFIPIAESSGFISTITHWLMHEACRQAAEWNSLMPPGACPLTLSINLSPTCLRQPDLVHWLEQALRLHGVLPQQLHLEIVETALLEEVELARRVFGDLRRLGVKVSLDDFGVGYSSLNYLTQYPIDTLKIDRSFVARATEVMQVAAVVRAIAALAHELNIDVVAEGVETQAQLDFVREAGCQYAQGNFLAPALSVDEAHALLVEHLHA